MPPSLTSPTENLNWCFGVLPAVSRTFAISIPWLRGTVGQAVLVGYLLCRVADTIEDDGDLKADEKAKLFKDFLDLFDNPKGANAFGEACKPLKSLPAYVELCVHVDRVLDVYFRLPQEPQRIVRRWVEEMVVGMEKFVRLYPDGIRLKTIPELKEYCYYVAGTVGHLLTELWSFRYKMSPFSQKQTKIRAQAFGEALQLVNILKDVREDLEKENAVYIPEDLLRAKGIPREEILSPSHARRSRLALDELIQLAQNDVREAMDYICALPRTALGARLFCVLPLLLAVATLRELTHSPHILDAGSKIKIRRREVKNLMLMSFLFVWSNRALQGFLKRVSHKEWAPLPL